MFNFTTLFNTNYLSKGLALYFSLEKVCENFHLYIFAFDDETYEVLKKLNLSKATIISLSEFENDELLRVKSDRTVAEYCWTATPATIYYTINKYNLDSCTYLDADVYFYSSPKVLFDEMGDNSVMITEHRFSPEYRKEIKKSGKYCVQFTSFKNDAFGMEALTWWKDQCVLWCYNRLEDGKFGDQMYLDDWTTRFKKIHELQHLGGGLAGWNISQYDFFKNCNEFYGVEKKTGNKFDVVFYHFHYLRYYSNGKIQLGPRIISDSAKELFYKPYLRELEEIKKKVQTINPNIEPHGIEEQTYSLRSPLSYLRRKLFGLYNLYKLDQFLK